MFLPPTRKLLPLLLLWAIAATAHAAPKADPLHAWVGGDDPAQLELWVNQRLAAEQASLAKLLAVTGPRTLANTLQPFDEAQNQLALAGNQAYLLFALGKTAPLRDKAQALNLGIFYQDSAAKKRWVLRFDDPKTLEQIDAVFVTVEPSGGSQKPSGKALLFASLRVESNHP